MPYNRKAEENAPSRKYFMAASCALERRVAPAMMYSDSDRISRAMNTTSRSEAAASSTMPVSANSSSGNTSGGAWPSACPSSEFPGPLRGGHQRREGAHGEQDDARVAGDAVQRDGAVEGDGAQVPVPPHQGGRDRQPHQRQGRERAAAGVRPERHDHEQDDPGAGQGQLRRDRAPGDLRRRQ